MIVEYEKDIFQQSISWNINIFNNRKFLDEEKSEELFNELNDQRKFRLYKITKYDENNGMYYSTFSDTKIYSLGEKFEIQCGNKSKIQRPKWITTYDIPEIVEEVKARLLKEYHLTSDKILVEKIEHGPLIQPAKHQDFQDVAMLFLNSSGHKLKLCYHNSSSKDMMIITPASGSMIIFKDDSWNNCVKSCSNNDSITEPVIVVSFMSLKVEASSSN